MGGVKYKKDFQKTVESVESCNNRSDRYIGYMAETLETLYFMKNSVDRGAETLMLSTRFAGCMCEKAEDPFFGRMTDIKDVIG